MCWSSYEERRMLEELRKQEREPQGEILRVEAETEEQAVGPAPVEKEERELVLS